MDSTLAAAQPVSCYAHLDVDATSDCERCDRKLCDVCAFETAAGKLCADCMTEGAGPSGAHRTLRYSVISIACASLGVVALGILFLGLQGLVGLSAGFLGVTAFLSFGVGFVCALSARDHARRTGSPLALIGLIGNGALLALYLVLCFIGASR